MKINIQKITRGLIPLVTILLIVSLSISALAARVAIDWRDYIDYTYPGIDYDINDVFIPYEKTGCTWLGYMPSYVSTRDSTFSYTFVDVSGVSYWNLYFSLFDDMLLDVSTLTNQTSLDVHFLLSGSVVGQTRYRTYVYYYDGSGNGLKTVESSWVYDFSFDTFTIPIDLSSMPDGTQYLSFRFQFFGDNTSDSPIVSGDTISITYLGISFETVSPGTLVFDPMIIEPEDYLVNESSNGTTSTLYVSVPADDITMQWHLLRDDDYSIIKQSYGNPFPVTLDRQEYDYWIDCLVYDKLDITDIVNGSTMSVDYRVLVDEGVYLPMPESVRYQVRYFDNAGNLLDNVNFFTIPDADFYDDTKLELVIDKPAGAVSMSFYLQFMDIGVVDPISFELYLDSINFVCDIPTMVRVQQETGRTNKLLQELIDGDPAYKDVIDEAIKDTQEDSDKIQDSIDKIEQLPKPEIDLDELVPDELAGQAYLNYIAVVRPIWESDLLMSMATIGVCVMVFSYLLFGKKG